MRYEHVGSCRAIITAHLRLPEGAVSYLKNEEFMLALRGFICSMYIVNRFVTLARWSTGCYVTCVRDHSQEVLYPRPIRTVLGQARSYAFTKAGATQ